MQGEYGDVSARKELRKRLNCKSFDWYIKNIFPELFIPGDAVASGEVCIFMLYSTFSRLTPSTPAVPNCCCLKGSAPYWSNRPFLIFDIRALWRSGQRQSARMSEIKNGRLDQYGKM